MNRIAEIKAPLNINTDDCIHSISGFVFDIIGEDNAAIQYTEINTLVLDGLSGNVSIWITSGGWAGKLDHKGSWQNVHTESFPSDQYSPSTITSRVHLRRPIRIQPGRCMGVYIHSDQNISLSGFNTIPEHPCVESSVMNHTMTQTPDNRAFWPYHRSFRPLVRKCVYRDEYLRVRSGCAKLRGMDTVFSGNQGGRWARCPLQSRLEYKVVHEPWSREIHHRFSTEFKRGASAFLNQQTTSWNGLPNYAVQAVLSYCHSDWFANEDDQKDLLSPELSC